jgi:hypothetical protein
MRKKTGITNRFIKLNEHHKIQDQITSYVLRNTDDILDEVIPEEAFFDMDKACIAKNRIRISIFVDYLIK